jgi:signal transduction histidine kinase
MDTGYGIPANELSQIFRPFYRASHQEAFVEGTGIGLAMVKELTDMMGGVISVESVEGQGSHFYVEFPLATSFPLPSSSKHNIAFICHWDL